MSFDITDTTPSRFDLGVQMLLDGSIVSFHGVNICLRDGTVHVGIGTNWSPECITERLAQEDIERGQSIYQALLTQRPDLAAKIAHLPVRYGLGHGWGMGEINICQSDGKTIQWDESVKPHQ